MYDGGDESDHLDFEARDDKEAKRKARKLVKPKFHERLEEVRQVE